MARPPLDPEIKRHALEAFAGGASLDDVARVLKGAASRATIGRWFKAARPDVAARAAALAAKAAPVEPLSADDPPDDTLIALRKMLAATWARAGGAERAGNYTAAQRFGRDAAAIANTIARVERGETDDADVLRISRREIDTAMAGVRERVRAIVDRPLLCAHCSRQLSVEFGTGARKDD